jgi:hypothetical protein
MRYSIVLALLASSIVWGQAPQTTKIAKIEEIFRLTRTDQVQKQMLAQMSAMISQQSQKDLPPDQRQAASDAGQRIMTFVSEKMSWDAMKAQYIKLYDDTYTEDEISGILMFYQSEPGQAMLAKAPTLMTNMVALVQKRMAELKPEMDKMIKETTAKSNPK